MIPQQEISTLLQTFQDGYTHRDLAQLDDFMELFTPDVEMIGTNGVRPGMDEWYTSRQAARAMIQGDWETWGDLRLDLDAASIRSQGEVGWIAATATVTQTIGQENYASYLNFISNFIANSPLPAEKNCTTSCAAARTPSTNCAAARHSSGRCASRRWWCARPMGGSLPRSTFRSPRCTSPMYGG